MRQAVLVNLAIVLVFFAITFHAEASTAAVSHPAAGSAEPDQCSSDREEDKLLCAVAQEKEASINQVIDEDETAKLEPEPPSASDKDVWAAAYEQWIAGKKPKGKLKAVNRAIEEALKRHPDAKAPEGIASDINLPELDDDELTVITAAVQNISSDSASSEDVIASLTTIEDLCYSGDNGRQMAASGGVPHLLRLATLETTSLLSIRALATCAQNNPAVFESAVAAGAVGVLLGVIDNDDSIRAASLRALVAIGDSENAMSEMVAERERVVRVVLDSLALAGTERRRCVIRALALIESCVSWDVAWKKRFVDAGLVSLAENEMQNGDVDVREGAARVLRLLR